MGSFLSGWLGPGVGMTTHTENIGVIGVTRVASRWTMVVAGVLLIILGLFTKVCGNEQNKLQKVVSICFKS